MNSIDKKIDHARLSSGVAEPLPFKPRLLDAARSIGMVTLQRTYHNFKEYSLPFGRFDFGSTEELTNEAMRRGANQKPEELNWLLDEISKNPPANVMEIGTRFGGVFFALAHLATENARLTSIDLPGGRFGGGYGRMGKRRLGSFVLPAQQFRAFQKDSHDPRTLEGVEEWLDGEPLDFLFIDGDHTKEGAQRDWEMYSPLVADGGLIGLHDIAFHTKVPECQVDEVWRTVVKPDRKASEFISQPDDWGGIGLVHVEQ